MGTLSVDKILKTSQGAAEFTLPATDGTAGQVWQTDGSGQLSLNNISGISVSATTLTASGAFTSLGIDDNADAIAITIDSSENVGIGDTAPQSKVHINDGDTGITTTDAGGLLVERTGGTWIQLLGSTTDSQGVIFSDSTYNVAAVRYEHNGDYLHYSTAQNTSLKMKIDSTGAMTKPLQPCFFAYNNTNVPNATGDNTLYGPIIYTTEMYDQGADYNTANGTFTAPVNGRYFLQAALSTGTQTSSHTDGTFDLITSNKTVATYYDPGAMEGSAFTGQCTISSSGVFDMDAGDTATTKIRIAGSTKNIDISTNNTWFSGVLVA